VSAHQKSFVSFSRAEVEQTVPQRFKEQADKYPNNIAVKTRRDQLTYSELNRSANRLAQAIGQRSYNNNPVALLLAHDAPAIIAILGVLKAGKCFVPIDLSLPRARIQYILDDSEATLVVANSEALLLAQDVLGGSRSLLNLDQLDTSVSVEDPLTPGAADNVSCILYTSGSTGLPKGVLHTHRNELHNAMHHTNSLCLSEQDRLTLFGSYSTGQGIQDIHCALMNGATLCPWKLKSDGFTGLSDWLIQERITIYHSAATIFRHFIRNLSGREEFSDLRIVRLGSEHVTWKDVEAYKRHFSKDCVFVNALSSSETKTIRQHVINKDTQTFGIVPVGYPVEDMDVFVVDENGRQLGPNQTGEIVVRSGYISPGYWKKPDLTSAAFLPNSGDPDMRIFRTGEWGRIASDGCLEHFGRKDAQIKIRGYRIETYETESALLKHPAVDQVIVLSRENPFGDKFLVAYIVADPAFSPTVGMLRRFLERRIPNYMVPSAFVFLQSLPFTPNGKVDRTALPEPSAARPVLDTAFVIPRDHQEEALAEIWSEILGINELGVHDNFFDLGGTSILAMQLVFRLESIFGANLSLKAFFESPTIDDLSRSISANRRSQQVLKRFALEPSVRTDNLPLSFSQQRLWFLDQWQPGNAVYNICRAHHLTGHMDVTALQQSIHRIVQRHEVLRTIFPAGNGHPTQFILPDLTCRLSVIDLADLPGETRQKQSSRLITEEASSAFDLSQGPLLRLTLVRLAEEEHLFIFTVHQIVCDGWSVHVFYRDFWALYEASCEKREATLPVLKFQFADFAVWQHQSIQGELLSSQLSFWKDQLGDALSVLTLPTDRCPPKLRSFRGARHVLKYSELLTGALNELSQGESVTLFMTLMAAYQTLLYRYTEQEDVVLGFPIANRNSLEARDVMGFFVNTLVARTDLTGNPRFTELLARVQDVCVAAYSNQDLPFEKLVEELHPQRDGSRNPLFQVMFAFQSPDPTRLEGRHVEAEPLEVDGGTSKFDLMLSLTNRGKDLTGYFEYRTDLFDGSTIERMAGNFQTLLEGIVADSDKRLSDLPLLTGTERYQLLTEWNTTQFYYPEDQCIHQLFEAQADRTSEAIALTFEDKEISYGELNKRANQLAHYLIELGVGPGTLVGVCLERSLDLIVGLLGILKAGGAYVPLDPLFPKERLVFMLQDAQVSILLTENKLYESLSVLSSSARFVRLDRDCEEIARQPDDNRPTKVPSDNLAYAIYTSGSTGRPKAVQVSHRSVVNCLYSIRHTVGFTEDDTFFALTTISFDIAALELFLPLLSGARVALANRDEVLDGKQLANRLASSAATVMQATPSTWRILLDASWQGVEGLKILCGGEVLTRSLANELLDGGASLWNLYGPTETTIWSTVAKVESGEDPVLIGRPIGNTQIYILDSYLQPVPVGVHGELYIGGDGVARGYLNQPELTTEKFIPDIFSDQTDARLYRTGDRARYRPDGNLEFLGRVDSQVKIRGHRIELGEIEFVLNQHPAVKESVVVCHESETCEEKELVAYIAPNRDSVFSVNDLRIFACQKLPGYMIPPTFVILEALPLTPNGKIDRKSLPPPDGDRPLLDQGFTEPRTEIEELVAQVWREVLKRDKIGVYDNFFDLGGHSLLATRVVARLRSAFQIDLALRKLFERPTVAGLAEHIETLRRSAAGPFIPPLVAIARNRSLPLSFSQRRLWYLQKVDSNLSAYNIPAAFRIRGDLNHAALEQALNDVLERHEVLRSYTKEIDGQPLQENVPGLRISLPMIDLTDLPREEAEAEANRRCDADARQLYDLGIAPLIRAALLKLATGEHVLMLNFHHIIVDGSSLAIFYRELGLFYEAACEGRKASLSPLPVQYSDFAAWQQEWLKSEAFDIQIAYWKRQLADLPPAFELPNDFDRPELLSHCGARVTRQLSDALTAALKTFSRQYGATTFMALFAAFNALLSRLTCREDIIVGSTIAGRNRPETEGLIGFFINALPLRTDLSGDPSFKVLLERVRETCLDAYTHQEMPFEKIVEELRPPRDPGHNPIFDILFNVADISERVMTLTGCDIARFVSAPQQAKFDLVLHAPEINGRIELAAIYNIALFKEDRIVLLLEQWANLLAQAVSIPELPISRLSLITENSKVLLPDPTATLDDKWEGAIHEILPQHARRSPDELALVDPNQSWSYRDLDKGADRLANALIAAGIKPKDRIAIYAERNSSLVVAIVGILKSGAAFLILDPAYPLARTIDYLRAAQPKGWLQLSSIDDRDELANYLDALDLSCRMKIPNAKGELLQSLACFADSAPDIPIGADDPAYIAFTSGSTGEPKGVVCRHGPITHFLPWQKDAFRFTANDRFAMLSGLAYGNLHRDVFTCVDLGATIFIPTPSEARSPDELASWLERNAITVLHLTPALGQLLTTGTRTRLPAVRRVFFGGDVLTMVDLKRISELAPNAVIGSFYGTTETQRAVGYYEITPDPNMRSRRTVPLGKGIRDVQLLVLNRSGKLAGVGELGEVFVRSPHLAAGYLGDDDRTQEMFMTNPFTQNPEDRLYRSGEVGRYLPDGNVEWAGRNDRRINIRGFRIELEEIESILKQHRAVKDAAVVLYESRDTESEGSTPLLNETQTLPIGHGEASEKPKSTIQKRRLFQSLIAYIVPTDDETSQSLSDLLYTYLSARLPDYMVPGHFVILSSLPLSPNGKIDYGALPPIRSSADSAATAPRNHIELKLQAIFAEVLGRSEIGIDDNFFRLGGHSLLAARAAARIGDAFSGLSLTLSDFLTAPTVKDLAGKIASSAGQINTASDKDEREEFDL
jgi:amino acid adenylation domain-containing protein